MRRDARVDATHGAIVKALRESGCFVFSMASLGAGLPDLCVGTPRGETWLLECKNPANKTRTGKLNDEQRAFMAAWPGKYAVVTSAEQAIAVVTA